MTIKSSILELQVEGANLQQDRVIGPLLVVIALVVSYLVISRVVGKKSGKLRGHQRVASLIWVVVALTGASYVAFAFGLFSIFLGALATAGALAFIIGLAVLPWLTDAIIGITLHLNPHIRPGSEIEVEGKRGRVVSINLTRTLLVSDECILLVPNRKLRDEMVVVYSTRRKPLAETTAPK